MHQFLLNVYVLCCNVPREQTLPALLGAVDVKLSQISLEYRRADHAIALQAASTGLASYLPDEPTTLHEAKVSPEWPQRRGALKREMDGQIARGVWKVVGRPKEKNVLVIKTVFKRKVGQDGRVEKYQCRFVAKRFRQTKGIHYQESSSPTPTQSSIRMALAVKTLLDWERRQLDVEMLRRSRRSGSERLFFLPFLFNLTYSQWTSLLPSCLWSQRIFPFLPGSRLTFFLSRCKFSTLTTRQPMVELSLLTFPRLTLRKKEHKSYFGKNRTHDFRTSRCAGYLLDHSGDEWH